MKRLLPTPHKFTRSESVSELIGFSGISVNIPRDDTVEYALGLIKDKFNISEKYALPLTLSYSDDPFFGEKNAEEQGYIIIRDVAGVTVYAKSSVGFLYACTTLLQLSGDAPETFTLYDRPDIRYRGNMNTLWAETGVFSYDFGDGMDAAEERIKKAIDQMVLAKLNLLYVDGYGFRSERFPGYNAMMTRISEYAHIRGMKTASGGYGMGYGASANFHFMGEVFRNRRPYPNGKIYDCIGTCLRDKPDMPIEDMMGRSYGTCLTNKEMNMAKIAELKAFIMNTGISVISMHNMDSDEIHEPLWLARCEECKRRYPSDSLYEKDGAAGAFAAFYDMLLDEILPVCPDLVLMPVSPGYSYHTMTKDENFEKCRRFWSSVVKYMRHENGIIPNFREQFVQKTDKKYRFDLIDEVIDRYGCFFFSSGDGFYSDKCYTPSAAHMAFMSGCEAVICANGISIQKPTQYANAEYLWNPTASSFYNEERFLDYDECTRRYNELREGIYRPEGIYGKGGLLDTSCKLLFGEKHGTGVADVYRLRGKNGECPIFTFCNVELFTNHNNYNLPFNWDIEISEELQRTFYERFSESTLVTEQAREILYSILEEGGLSPEAKEHIEFLAYSAKICAKYTSLVTRYMRLYIEADKFFRSGTPYGEDILDRIKSVRGDAESLLSSFEAEGRKPFDIYGGIFTRREELMDCLIYFLGQIEKSILTDKRVPDERRPIEKRKWW